MTQLQILTQFSKLFTEVKQSLDNYNNNLINQLFEIEPNEDQNKAYKRGETIYDKCEDDLRNISNIIDKETEIIEFF